MRRALSRPPSRRLERLAEAAVCSTTRKPDGGKGRCVLRGICGTSVGCRGASDHVMGAVAEGLVVGALAAAQVEGARAFRHEAVRLQGRGLVRAVAEGLLGRAPACAPEIRPSRPPASPGRGPSGRRPARRTSGNLPEGVRPSGLIPRTRNEAFRSMRRSDPEGLTRSRTLSFSFSTILAPASSTQVNSNSPGPGTFMKKER